MIEDLSAALGAASLEDAMREGKELPEAEALDRAQRAIAATLSAATERRGGVERCSLRGAPRARQNRAPTRIGGAS